MRLGNPDLVRLVIPDSARIANPDLVRIANPDLVCLGNPTRQRGSENATFLPQVSRLRLGFRLTRQAAPT